MENNDCLFCKITKGTIPSVKVFENDYFFAFLDIMPLALGHTLIVPKIHCRNVFDTPDNVAAHFYPVISKVAKAVKLAFKADGVNIMQFNEPAAGQTVFHAHVHIVPRFEGDNMDIILPKRLEPTKDELITAAEKIKTSLQ